jgi:hypothetical protein
MQISPQKGEIAGCITLKEQRLLERYFPGILELYQRLEPKPKTFLELAWRYQSGAPQPRGCAGGEGNLTARCSSAESPPPRPR